jgi:hypothetical protein
MEGRLETTPCQHNNYSFCPGKPAWNIMKLRSVVVCRGWKDLKFLQVPPQPAPGFSTVSLQDWFSSFWLSIMSDSNPSTCPSRVLPWFRCRTKFGPNGPNLRMFEWIWSETNASKLCRCIESRRWEQGPHSHPFLLGWPFKLGSSNNPLVVHALKCPDLPKISASPIKDWISSFPSIPNQALCRSPSRFHLTQVGHHGLLPTDAPNWKLENGPGSSQQWAAANQAKGSNVKRCKSYII